MTDAKRGDLVLVEYRKDYSTKAPEFELEKVSSVARDGLVKATIRYLNFSTGRETDSEPLYRTQTSHGRPFKRFRCYYHAHFLVPAASVDADALWQAWKERYNAADWLHKGFASVDEAKSFVKPYRTEVAA